MSKGRGEGRYLGESTEVSDVQVGIFGCLFGTVL